jgi:hypothetical protein
MKNPNFYYTSERQWASYTSEPGGESWDPLLNTRRSWGYPRVYLSYYMDYFIKRTGHFDVSYVGHVIFFTLAIEKKQKNIGWLNKSSYTHN